MNSTIVRKWTTLGVGLAMLAGILVAANSASATTCYRVLRGFIISYDCYYGETPICYSQSAAGPVVVPCPPSTTPTPPPPKPPVVVIPPKPTPPKPPVVVVPPARVATKLVLLTKAGTLSGATNVSVAAKLTDLRGNARKSAPVYLCWKPATAAKESCAARTTTPSALRRSPSG